MKRLNHRVYPIFILAFLRVYIASASEYAILIHFSLININTEIIGIIVSIRSFAYLFSPLLFKNVPERIGHKMCLLISIGGFLFIYFMLQIFLNPLWCFFLLFLDGILLGLFWPVLISSVSFISNHPEIQKNDVIKDKLFKNYGLSQSIGGIISLLLGSILLYIFSDIILVLYMCFILAVISFIIVLRFQEPQKYEKSSIILNRKKGGESCLFPTNMKIPLIFPMLLIAIYAISIGIVSLLFPLKSSLLNFAFYTIYFFSFIRSIAQMVSMAISMKFSLKTLKKLIPFSALMMSLSMFLMGLNSNLFLFGFLFILFGLSVSIFYVFSFKLIIFLNASKNSSKYSVYYETIFGLSFWVAPVIAGFIAAIEINFAFYLTSLIILFSLGIYILFKNKIILL